jgi:hypothetical protein
LHPEIAAVAHIIDVVAGEWLAPERTGKASCAFRSSSVPSRTIRPPPIPKKPIVRNGAEGRELATARWGMPSSQPSYTRSQLTTVRDMDGQDVGEIAKIRGLSRQTIYRIKADPIAAEAVLTSWAV